MDKIKQYDKVTTQLLNTIIDLLNAHETKINNISTTPISLHSDTSKVGCIMGIKANSNGYWIPAGGTWFVYEYVDMWSYNCVGPGYGYVAGGRYWHGEHWEWGNRRGEYTPICLAIRIA